tara:strand:- start:4707 stop:6113 length:1407 start_codon:yes stop_codon:yes gene_type:complete
MSLVKTIPSKQKSFNLNSFKKAPTYWITTFGCQMNKADSERMAGILENMGYKKSSEELYADLVIYNTCTIRDKAEQKVYSFLGRQAKRKHKNPNLKLVIAGCLAQQEGEKLLRRVPELDLVMGPQHANKLQSLLEKVETGQQVAATEESFIEEDITTARRDSSICAWVNIIYGCNERCTYCVVPAVRGSEQSRKPISIKNEIHLLSMNGYKEITLLGQNIDAYGRDLPKSNHEGEKENSLKDLLYYIHDIEGIERIRFATSHPRYFSKELIKACFNLNKVCEHFHIPFQSGDNKLLKAMSRGYTTDKYKEIIYDIRELMPEASITTDVIVGFPGETEMQFNNTLSLIKEIKFDQVNTAAYSPRPNTPAANWDNQIKDNIKVERLKHINNLVEEIAKERNQRYLNNIEEILVEGINPKNNLQMLGRTRTNRLAFFPYKDHSEPKDLIGNIIDIQVKEIKAFSITGIIHK